MLQTDFFHMQMKWLIGKMVRMFYSAKLSRYVERCMYIYFQLKYVHSFAYNHQKKNGLWIEVWLKRVGAHHPRSIDSLTDEWQRKAMNAF